MKDPVQRFARDVLHNDARPVGVGDRGVVQADDVRVLEAGHELHFLFELLAERRLAGDLLVQHFDHGLAAGHHVLGQVDLAHAAFAEKLNDLVPVQEYPARHRIVPLESYSMDVATRFTTTLVQGLSACQKPARKPPFRSKLFVEHKIYYRTLIGTALGGECPLQTPITTSDNGCYV